MPVLNAPRLPCDLYFPEPVTATAEFCRWLAPIRQPLTEGEVLHGFAGFNLTRLMGVVTVVVLRQKRIFAFNIPVIYRDQVLLDLPQAIELLRERHGIAATEGRPGSNPMFFTLSRTDLEGVELHEGGGKVTVDRLDGHVWDGEEHAEYAYDYNNQI